MSRPAVYAAAGLGYNWPGGRRSAAREATMARQAWLAVDLGGTNTRVGLADDSGLAAWEMFATQAQDGPQAWLTRLGHRLAALMERAGELGLAPAGVGIASAGVLDRTGGRIINSPNLPWFNGLALAQGVAKAAGLPAVLENDANLYALGEHRYGAGRGRADMACLTLGTGVGGGLILGGELVTGPLGTAGELGHVAVEHGGRRCGCGALGCLEAYASATGLKGILAEALAQGRATTLGPGDGVKAMEDAAVRGDALARELFTTAGRMIGRLLCTLVAVTGLDTVVVGGGVARGWFLIEPAALAELRDEMKLADPSGVTLVRGQLDDAAALLGAAALAAQRLGGGQA